MRHATAISTLLLTPLLLAPLFAAEDAPAPAAKAPATTRAVVNTEPAKLIRRFQQLLKSNDLAGARALIAASPAPVADTDKRLARLAKRYATEPWTFVVLDTREAGDVAVGIVLQRPADAPATTFEPEQWYLIRQGGEWRILGKFFDYSLPEYGFESPIKAKYKALEDWADERAEELRKEQPGCKC